MCVLRKQLGPRTNGILTRKSIRVIEKKMTFGKLYFFARKKVFVSFMVRVSLIGFLMMVEFFWHDIKIGEEVCMKVESQSGAK